MRARAEPAACAGCIFRLQLLVCVLRRPQRCVPQRRDWHAQACVRVAGRQQARPDARAVTRYFYAHAEPNRVIAALAPAILRLATEGDHTAHQVLIESAGELLDLANRVAAMTENKFRIQVFPAGELVPGLEAADAASLKALYEGIQPDVILLDLKLPDADGLVLLPQVKKNWPEAEVIVLTGHGSIEAAVEATKRGAYHFQPKPLDGATLKLQVERALEARRDGDLLTLGAFQPRQRAANGLVDAGIQNLQISLRMDPLSKRLSCVIQGTESEKSLKGGKLRTHVSSFLRVMYVVFEDVRFINNDGQVNVMFYYAK